MMMKQTKHTLLAMASNFLLLLICYTLCRIEFLWENSSIFQLELWSDHFWNIFRGGMVFDISAICYTNALYAVLVLLPFHKKESKAYHRALKWLFVIVNALCLVMNLCDSVYYPYSFHRVTTQVFNEFGGNDNLGKIFSIEFINHWYLVLLGIIMIAALWFCYSNTMRTVQKLRRYYVTRLLSFALTVFLLIWGIRGSIGSQYRPINVGSAYDYTPSSAEINIVLNSPFSMIRTISKRPPTAPEFFDRATLDKLYSPVHLPSDSIMPRKKNVVILIVESFAKEFIWVRRCRSRSSSRIL